MRVVSFEASISTGSWRELLVEDRIKLDAHAIRIHAGAVHRA
ncbi:hypothetical protein MY4824_001991 [Beauveria thailandica]